MIQPGDTETVPEPYFWDPTDTGHTASVAVAAMQQLLQHYYGSLSRCEDATYALSSYAAGGTRPSGARLLRYHERNLGHLRHPQEKICS